MPAPHSPSAARRHLLGIADLSVPDIHELMDRSESEIAVSLGRDKKKAALRGRTQINLFFEASTRTQASFELAGKRLGALTIRRRKGRVARLVVAICGDVLHSRVARSNILLLNALGAQVRVVGPSTLLPTGIEQMGVEVFRRMEDGLAGADVVMMLRLQRERMAGAFVPSVREYFRFFGLDTQKLAHAKPDALVMHPGPMNRGVEIASEIADGPQSVIEEQVEMGVAVRMAVMEWMMGNPQDVVA